MALSTQASGTGTGSPMSLTWPTVAANDIAQITWTVDTSAPGTITYTNAIVSFGIDVASTRDGQSAGVAWKRCTSTESGGTLSVSGTGIGAGNPYVVGVTIFSGRSTSVDPTALSTNNSAANSSPVTATAPSITASSGADLCVSYCPDPSVSGATNTWSYPGGWTERVNTENTFADLTMITQENVSAGATGTVVSTFTLTSGVAGWMAFHVHMPSTGGGGGATSRNKMNFLLMGVGT